MQKYSLFHIFISRLNQLNVRYMVTGSVAGIIYGEPRLTNDIDLILNINTDYVDQFFKAFPIEEFYCPPPEIIRVEIGRHQRGHFNLIHHETGFKADIYTSGRDRLHKWAFDNMVTIDVEGEIFCLAPIEYVILRKLEYYREGGSEKHLLDINNILSVSFNKIDFTVLEKKISENTLLKEWNKVRTDL